MWAAERTALRGTVLDRRYRVGACIGVGGTGVVFEGVRLFDGYRVVIKTVRPSLPNGADLARRLRREGEVARRVRHPGLARALDEGLLDDGTPYLVIERIEGESLARLLHRRGRLLPTHACTIAQRLAGILQTAHDHGYVHRDVKPEHVLLERGVHGELLVRLIDFGVCASKYVSSTERESERGRVFGTPSYASPEQAAGEPDVDGRADVYGLGVLLYECLSGRLPFSAPTVNDLLRRVVREDAPSIQSAAPHVSVELSAVIHRALARDRRDRLATPSTFARALAPHVGLRSVAEHALAAEVSAGVPENAWIPTVRVAAA